MNKNSKINIPVSKPQPTAKEYNDYTEYTKACNELAKVMRDLEAHDQFLRMARDTEAIKSLTTTLFEFQTKVSSDYSKSLISE